MTASDASQGSAYRVRYCVFHNRRGGNVYHPAGRDAGSKKHGRPTVPPKPFKPPVEQIREVASLALARQLALELRLEHGDDVVAIHVEPVEHMPAEPRPKQLSFADLAGWPRGWPRQRWTRDPEC
jgi:hypothetical protein